MVKKLYFVSFPLKRDGAAAPPRKRASAVAGFQSGSKATVAHLDRRRGGESLRHAAGLVPRSIDSPRTGGFVSALMVDLALLLVFAVQHSGMARRGFKQWLTRFIPEAAERSTFVLATCVALIALFAFWRPLGGTVWTVEQPAAAVALYVLCVFGWLLVLVATFLINHFDLFGLRQVWLHLMSAPYRPVAFGTPGPYRLVRHPLYVGFIFAFWSTPTMTATHLLFAVVTTAYILVAIQLEERDLIANLGDAYRDYRRRVPMIVPFTRASGERGLTNNRMSA